MSVSPATDRITLGAVASTLSGSQFGVTRRSSDEKRLRFIPSILFVCFFLLPL